MPCGHTSTPMTLSSTILVILATPIPCARVSRCADDISTWCKSRHLQLNANKTEAIWFGSQANLTKLNSLDCSVRVGSFTIQSSTVVRDLGLHLDNELSMKQHATKVAATCYYHLRHLRHFIEYKTPRHAWSSRWVQGSRSLYVFSNRIGCLSAGASSSNCAASCIRFSTETALRIYQTSFRQRMPADRVFA